ncbi:MAG: hypothetical protein ACRCYQ_04335 [Nocardioides sp.]
MNKETTPTAVPETRPGAAPNPELVVSLQSVRGYPCVSLLCNTTPGERMYAEDAARLRALVRRAETRLRAEEPPGAESAILADLRHLADEAAKGPTSSATALFASATVSHMVRLPVPVKDRVTIDPTFATRDLVRALHHAPRHVVLVLDSTQARLFETRDGILQPVARSAFPLSAPSARGVGDRSRRDRRQRSRDEENTRFYRKVDGALGTYLRLHPAPVVFAGPQRVVAGFRAVSTNTARLAGTVHGNLTTTPLEQLTERVGPVVRSYLRSREREALALLERRAAERRAVSGIDAAWLAARAERPEMLVVERGFYFPARISADGDFLVEADDIEDPEVIDDAVDELIEMVLGRGGWIALTEDRALHDHGRIALTLRG